MTPEVQFISASRPLEGLSPQSRRRTHSHAAREAHARARRLRTARYQERKAAQHGGKGQEPVQEPAPGPTGLGTPERPNGEQRALAVPSPVGPWPADRGGSLAGVAGRFRPIEHFLLDHYMGGAIPHFSLNCNLGRILDGQGIMFHDWVRLALTDEGFLSGLMLAACRSLCQSHYHEEYFAGMAMQYKVTCLGTLSRAISSDVPVVSDATVGQVIALALDEFALGDLTAVRHHVQGAVKMVAFKGGPQTLGLNGCLELLFNRLLYDMSVWERSGRVGGEDSQLADSLSA